jgi:hypothetical protein
MSCFVQGPVILIGYTYRLQIETEAALFPSQGLFEADIRGKPSDPFALTTLTSAEGTLSRISDTRVEIKIPSTATARFTKGSVMIDLVRRDLPDPLHLGFSLEIPVHLPITRDPS